MIEKFLNKAAGSLQPALYVVATPIGNLADITLRALAVLGRADLVCAEDTRVTAQLLAAYGIQAKLMSVREHNEQQMAGKEPSCSRVTAVSPTAPACSSW